MTATPRFCSACGTAATPGDRFCQHCGAALVAAGSAPAPARLGTYVLERELARGGMGVVYRARDERLGRSVALKLLRDEYGSDPEFRDRFTRESRAAASLDHPNVLPVFDAGEIDGTLYLASRLVDGEDLRRLVERQGPLPADRALRLVGQVGAALDYAHARGVVHRDVKPANVLVVGDEDDEHAYLIDFGITKRVEDTGLTVTGGFIGTPEYAAPEQITSGPLDGRADQYALAGLLFFCLTGRSPYARESAPAVLDAHLRETPPAPSGLRPDLPAAVDTAIARALSKDPEHRFASCRAFVAAARPAGDPSPAADTTPTTRVPAPTTPHRALKPVPPAGAQAPPATAGRRRTGPLWALAAAIAAGLVVAGVLIVPGLGDGDGGGGGSSADDDTPVRTVTQRGEVRTVTATTTSPTPAPTPDDEDRRDGGDEGSPLEGGTVAFGEYAADGYAAALPERWRVTKDDVLETNTGGVVRRRTTVTDADRGVSVVIDHLTGFETPPQENRAQLDATFSDGTPGYERVGFDDYDLAGRAVAEWRYRLRSDGGRTVQRVNLMFEDGDDDFAVMATGDAGFDTLDELATRVAESITVE